MPENPLLDAIERQVEAMGLEVVELEQAGNAARPILRLYIDRPDSVPGDGQTGVSLEDCARVSRTLEPMLDEREDLSERYVLEVSSPGVERPLTRRRDYTRFAGQEVALRGKAALAGRAKRLQGTLVGLRDEERAVLRLEGGEEVEVPLGDIDRANLVYRWERGERSRNRTNPEE
jgi:ribosome maturation factor RimP